MINVLKNKLLIVVYHQVTTEHEKYSSGGVTQKQLDQHVSLLKKAFNILPFNEALFKFQSGKLPKNSLVITFDDGYKDNVENALPVLKKHKSSGLFFVCPGLIENDYMWNDVLVEYLRKESSQQEVVSVLGECGLDKDEILINLGLGGKGINKIIGLVKYLEYSERRNLYNTLIKKIDTSQLKQLMSADNIKELHRSGMEVGSHSLTHPILSCQSEKEALNEIVTSKLILEELISEEIRYFAYPNGKLNQDYSDAHAKMVESAGYKAGLSTNWGTLNETENHFHIPRVSTSGSRLRLMNTLRRVLAGG